MNTVQTPDYDLTGGATQFDAVTINAGEKVMVSIESTLGAAGTLVLQTTRPGGSQWVDMIDNTGSAIELTLDATEPNFAYAIVNGLIVGQMLRLAVKAAGTGIINSIAYN